MSAPLFRRSSSTTSRRKSALSLIRSRSSPPDHGRTMLFSIGDDNESIQVALVEDTKSSSYMIDRMKYIVRLSKGQGMIEGRAVDADDRADGPSGGGHGHGGNTFTNGDRERNDEDNSNCNNHKHDGNRNNNNNNDSNRNNNNSNESNRNNSNYNRSNPTSHPHFSPQRCSFALASTLPNTPLPTTPSPPSWTPLTQTQFHVRHGPNYSKTGRKEPSLPSLYEVYCVRYFRSRKRTVGGATRILPLPSHEESFNGAVVESHPELRGGVVPDVLVVHFMLPFETPTVFKQKDDGAGGECVIYLRPSKRFLDEVSGRRPMTTASKLLERWCRESRSSAEMRGRFKCMALVKDVERHNFGLLKSYNGKPVLITESGRVYRGNHGDVQYLEMTANVHHWAYMAKKGFVSLIPKFKNMQMEVGFTIEGRAEHELPECMLGSTMLSFISENTGPIIPEGMQEPVHEHQD